MVDEKPHAVRFHDDNKVRQGSRIETGNAAFMVLGSKLMECHQGASHRKKTDQQVVVFVASVVACQYMYVCSVHCVLFAPTQVPSNCVFKDTPSRRDSQPDMVVVC